MCVDVIIFVLLLLIKRVNCLNIFGMKLHKKCGFVMLVNFHAKILDRNEILTGIILNQRMLRDGKMNN